MLVRERLVRKVVMRISAPSYVNFRAKIALNAVSCTIVFIFSLIMEL